MPDDGQKTTEIMTAIFFAICQQRNNQLTQHTDLPSAVTDCINRVGEWYRTQDPPTEEDAVLAIELLELLVKGDFDSFLDELSDLMDGCDLSPLPRMPAVPAIWGDVQGDDEGLEEAG